MFDGRGVVVDAGGTRARGTRGASNLAAVRRDQGSLIALAVSVVLLTGFVSTSVGIGHGPQPNDLPVVIVPGADRDLYAAFVERGFSPTVADDRREGREEVLAGNAYAVVEPGEPLVVASAASFTAADLLTATFSPGRQVDDVRPLDPDDPRGTSINVTLLPLIAWPVVAALLSHALASRFSERGRLAILALSGLGGAVAVMVVVRGVIGAMPGSLLALSGVAALGVIAIATVTAGLVRWLGWAGAGVSVLVFLVVGHAASGAASAPELLPDPWSWFGQLLPPGAMATGLRNVAYFDAAEASRWLVVLLVWAAAGVASLASPLTPRRRRPPLESPLRPLADEDGEGIAR
ncbi:MAG TPA: hypothetical protein VF549_08245 [Solirubrobacteraceae bacterium]|jgi:hypothetical protein